MVWFNCITAFRGNLDDAASHGPLAALPRFGARVTAGGRPPVRAGADLRAQRSRLALVRCLRERRSLVLEVHLDGKAVYSSAFPICQSRRSEIRPEPQQRILEFRFDAEPKRFRAQDKAEGTQLIVGNIWEAGRKRDAIRLGVSFATEQRVLLNTIHVARAHAPSRSERVRGLVITTRPTRRANRSPR